MTRQLFRYAIAVMATILGLAVLWQFRVAVIYVLISVALAATYRPLVNRLVGKPLWSRVGWVALYLVSLVIGGYLLFRAGRAVFNDVQSLASSISTQDAWSLPTWLRGTMLDQMVFARLLPPSHLLQITTYGQSGAILPALLGITQNIASLVSSAFLVIGMSAYWVLNKTHFERLWLSMLAPGQRKPAREIWQTLEPELGTFLRSQLAVNVITGMLLGLGYWLIGSPFPILLAVLGAFVSAIPFIGVFIAVIIPIVVGLVTGMQSTPVIILYTLVVMIAFGIWIKPRLFERRWDNPVLTLILLVGMAESFGLLGIIVAPPLSVMLQIIWWKLVEQRTLPQEQIQVSNFKQRQESVMAAIQAMEEPPPPQLTSTMERLAKLIEKAEPILQAAQNEPSPNKVLPGIPASKGG